MKQFFHSWAVKRFHVPKVWVLVPVFCMLLFLGGCEALRADARMQSEWIASLENCWPCALYKAAFDAINQLILNLYPAMSSKALMVMGVGLLFWLAFTTGKMITSLHEPDTKKYVQTVALVLFKAILVAVVLSQPQYFICFVDMVVSPVLVFFTQLSRIAITANVSINDGITWPGDFSGTDNGMCNVFSPMVKYQLQDIIFRVYLALGSGLKLGFNFMMEVNIINWILGPIIMWFFFIMMLIFPWIFIDSFIRLGAVIVLAPFFLIAWVFPATKDKVKYAWTTLSGAGMQLLIGCIYIGLIIGVIKAFEAQNWPGMMGDARQGADPGMMANFRRMSVEAVSFFALLMIMNRMQKNIPNISGALGGDSMQSNVVGFFDGIKKLTISVLEIALGAAMSAFGIPGGDRLMKAGAERMAEQVKEGAQGAAKDATETGSGQGLDADGNPEEQQQSQGGSLSGEINRIKNAGQKDKK